MVPESVKRSLVQDVDRQIRERAERGDRAAAERAGKLLDAVVKTREQRLSGTERAEILARVHALQGGKR